MATLKCWFVRVRQHLGAPWGTDPSEGLLHSDCEVGDRVIYHDPTPLHGVFHAVVTRRVTMPSGTVRFELDLEDPRPGDPPFRFAVEREIHPDMELCLRCTTDVSVAADRFLRR
ncbi:MAG TPA: hypothetical protein VK771_02960 [Acidimicrobiia bacterium]|nr:hypothetical protein [Acidimicrobiia bacterium]